MPDGLTQRELDILQFYADGLRSTEIAELVYLSNHTVAAHKKHAMRKLGVHTVTHAVAVLLRDGRLK